MSEPEAFEDSLEQDLSVRSIITAKLAAKQIKNPEKQLFRTPGVTSKYVQEILEKDMEVPWVFRSIDDRISKMQAHIDTMKPIVEKLIFWENLTASIAMSISIFVMYFVGYFKCHILWMILGMMMMNVHYRRNMIRLRRKIAHDIRVQNARASMETDNESTEWLNFYLDRYWSQYEPGLSEMIASNVNYVLETSKPAFLDDLRLSQFTLGSEAPRIEYVKVYPNTEDDIMMFDCDICFQPFDEGDLSKRAKEFTNKRNSKIELTARLGKGVASIPIPVLLTEVEIRGVLRIQIKFSSIFPHMDLIEFGFLEKPSIDFVLRPLKGMDLMDAPGLSTFLHETIDWALESSIVNPNMIKLPLADWFSGSGGDKPIGVMFIHLRQGRDLKNLELTGKSDPYVKMCIGTKEVARSKTIEACLDPVWDETKFVIVYSSQMEQEVKFEVMDWNNLQKDRLIGSTETLNIKKWFELLNRDPQAALTSEELTLIQNWGTPEKPTLDLVKPLHLPDQSGNKKSRGEIRMDLSYIKVPDTPPTAAVVNSGILQITVHQAKELPIASRSCHTFVTIEVNNNEEVGRTIVRRRTNTPVWEQNFDVFVSDVESFRFKFTLREQKDIGSNTLGYFSLRVQDILNPEQKLPDWHQINLMKSGRMKLSFKFLPIPIAGEQSTGVIAREAIGVVRLSIVEAKGLLNVESFRKSDPYTLVTSDGKQVAKTHVIDNTLTPHWNDISYFVVYSLNSKLQFHVFDHNDMRKDKSLGKTEFSLAEIFGGNITPPSESPSKETRPALFDTDMEIYKKDGLQVRLKEKEADLWCPLYLQEESANFPLANFKMNESKEKDRTISGKSSKQKGFLHVKMEYFKALPSAITRQLQSPEPVTGETHPSPVIDDKDGSPPRFSVQKAPLMEFSRTGVLRVLVHEANNLPKITDCYFTMKISYDDTIHFTSSIVEKSDAPIWQQIADVLVKNVEEDFLNIQVWQSTGKEVLDPNDVCIASWKVTNLMSLVGQGGVWVVSDPTEQKISLRLSISFQCIKMSLENVDIGNTSGRLFLDIIEGLDLEAVDSGGTSDPYCAISLNHKLVAKTQVHKKTLSPRFNESFEIKIESRRRALLQIEVRDYNVLQKHVVLGSIQLHLSGIQEGEEFTDIYHLDGARKGSLKLRMLFQPEDMATLASAKTIARSKESVAEKRRESIAEKRRESLAEKRRESNAEKRRESTADKKRDPSGKPEGMKEQIALESDAIRESSLDSTRSVKLKVKQFSGLNPSSSTEIIPIVHYGSMRLNILEARNLKAVDSNGLSDPYVKVIQVKHGKQKSLYKTSVVKKTLNPVFRDEKLTLEFPPEDILLVIKDHNLMGGSVEMGEAHFNVAEEIMKQVTVEMSLPFKLIFDRWIVIGLGGQGELHISGEIIVDKKSEDVGLKRQSTEAVSSNASLQSISSKSGIKRLFSKSKDLNQLAE